MTMPDAPIHAHKSRKTDVASTTEKFIEAISGMSCREAAKATGISPATISRVCRGGKPDIDTFAIMLDYVNVRKFMQIEVECSHCNGVGKVKRWMLK